MVGFNYINQITKYLSIKTIIILVVLIGLIYYIFITYTNNKSVVDDENVEDRKIIKVVSREDFVAGYVGQSELKTKKLLEDNIGKVLFIDEAYSLIPEGNIGDVDFGNQIMNILNKFMSENADKIAIVFAGYPDKIKNSLFASQPGLERRITYTFNCEKYNTKELWLIFLKHLEGTKYKLCLEDQQKIYENIIMKNLESFDKGQAGDMKKLLKYSSDNMISRVTKKMLNGDNGIIYDVEDDLIRYEDVDNGMKEFNKNKLSGGNKKSMFVF
jgi:hypothetical protein